MTGKARTFDELTHWDVWDRRHGTEGWSQPGWALPSDNSKYISRDDTYWNHVLDKARTAYGDPNIHYNTDTNVGQQRSLVFGDGTPLPSNGTIVYHDSVNHTNWIQNVDGTVSRQNFDGTAGPAIKPAGYRPTSQGSYAPLDAHGNQVAPLTGGMPTSDHGFYTDPKTGILTPKNAAGDYYTFDPATGTKQYFRSDGQPISEQQFNNAESSRSPKPPGGQALPTDEQQSGRAADAVKKLHGELQNRYSQLSEAEEKLSEALLNAHATTTDGQQKLNAIQQKIIEAINNPSLSLDSPPGEQAFLKFLRGQVAAIADVVQSGSLAADDQSKTIAALAGLYAMAPDNPAAAGPAQPSQQSGPAPLEPAAAAPVDDAGSWPGEQLPDPALSDPGLGGSGVPVGADPLGTLASALPAAMGAVPAMSGLGSAPLDSLPGMAGLPASLAGLGGPLGDSARHDEPQDSTDKPADKNNDEPDHATKDEQHQHKPDTDPPSQPPGAPQPGGNPGDGVPEAAPVPAPAHTTVALPDGSTANARTPTLAQAVKAYLAGNPVDAAYRQAGIELPPPGTPVTNPVNPSQLSCGLIGMFKDHYVVALSSVKALQDGQVVPLSSVASSPDFLGWVDPTAQQSTAQPPPGTPLPPAQQPAPAPTG
ncbi:DUF4226 domain-containing protein [Mycobacterium branderi]|uniref:Biofilm regulator BssS n=1 Tax=Mycobacterium branderi TaxID=43348 RepID=A0A7I7WBU2_9MYCO|nr:DUF4226 domain-containing protein [Mycobacterium branderi]MCV7235285.1 DUF4226 domain-containing protein [Mycobacterium branderi]ORA29881.1 hypothetical protein BST20_27925 [Mycobacterium branderi]BBZ15059.1 hypothetical protein MBRA_52540 [Mycobacterium branderi]